MVRPRTSHRRPNPEVDELGGGILKVNRAGVTRKFWGPTTGSDEVSKTLTFNEAGKTSTFDRLLDRL